MIGQPPKVCPCWWDNSLASASKICCLLLVNCCVTVSEDVKTAARSVSSIFLLTNAWAAFLMYTNCPVDMFSSSKYIPRNRGGIGGGGEYGLLAVSGLREPIHHAVAD